MTDLVERLRNYAERGYPICEEAADEIERLRNESIQIEYRRLDAMREIERLRAALQAIHAHALMGHDDAATGFITICGMVRDALKANPT